MVQPDFWLGWSIASDKLSHTTRKPTRCWKLALVVRLNILRFVFDLKRKCWHFPAFEIRSQLLKGFHLRVFFIHAVHLFRPFKHVKIHIPTRVTMPSCLLWIEGTIMWLWVKDNQGLSKLIPNISKNFNSFNTSMHPWPECTNPRKPLGDVSWSCKPPRKAHRILLGNGMWRSWFVRTSCWDWGSHSCDSNEYFPKKMWKRCSSPRFFKIYQQSGIVFRCSNCSRQLSFPPTFTEELPRWRWTTKASLYVPWLGMVIHLLYVFLFPSMITW